MLRKEEKDIKQYKNERLANSLKRPKENKREKDRERERKRTKENGKRRKLL